VKFGDWNRPRFRKWDSGALNHPFINMPADPLVNSYTRLWPGEPHRRALPPAIPSGLLAP